MAAPAAAGAPRPTLADRVAEQLRRLIERGDFPRDSRLPTEFELSRRFDVSRPVLRAALARLKQEGLIASHQGSGSVVLRGPDAAGLRFPAIETVADIDRFYEFRIAVESATARLAAERHTPATLAAIEAAIAEAEAAEALGAPALSGDLNFRFHHAVAAASENAFFLITIDRMPNLIGIGPVEVRHFNETDPAVRTRLLIAEHRRILEAIRARDGMHAAAEMAAHIGGARRHVYQRQRLSG